MKLLDITSRTLLATALLLGFGAPRASTLADAPRGFDDAWLRSLSRDELWAVAAPERRSLATLQSSLAPLQGTIARELAARLDYSEQTPDVTVGRYRVFTTTPKGSFYPRLYRRLAGVPDSQATLLLDLAVLARDTGFVDLGGYALSEDARWLAYSVDTSGSRRYELHVRDLASGVDRVLPGANISSFDFAPDGDALYVVAVDAIKRPFQVRRVELATLAVSEVFTERDERFRVAVSMSSSGRMLQILTSSSTSSEAWVVDERSDDHRARLVLPRRAGVYYDIEDWKDALFVRSNREGGGYGLYRLPYSSLGDASGLQPVSPPQANRVLTGMKAFERALVVTTRENGHSFARRLDRPDGALERLATPPGAASLDLGVNTDFHATDVRLLASSFTMPLTVAAASLDGRAWHAEFVQGTPASFDPHAYCEGTWQARSDDGTPVPIPYVYKGSCAAEPRDRPLLLSVYGAYGVPNTPGFSLNRLSLLDRGFVVAIAQVRGGGEFGDDWYDAGRGCGKQHGVQDFEAALRWLQGRRVSTPDRTVVAGQSAGGVIVGMTVDDAPELLAAAVLDSAFLDVETTMRQPGLPNTIAEYMEWGNPADARELRCMKNEDPMQNVERARVPRLLVRAGLQDEQVMPAEALRFVRRVRSLADNADDVFLDIDRYSGHDGPSDATRYFDRLAFELAFMVQSTTSGPAFAMTPPRHGAVVAGNAP